jgi:hypothetical protein
MDFLDTLREAMHFSLVAITRSSSANNLTTPIKEIKRQLTSRYMIGLKCELKFNAVFTYIFFPFNGQPRTSHMFLIGPRLQDEEAKWRLSTSSTAGSRNPKFTVKAHSSLKHLQYCPPPHFLPISQTLFLHHLLPSL